MARIFKTQNERKNSRLKAMLSVLLLSTIVGALFTASPSSAYKKIVNEKEPRPNPWIINGC